MKARVDESKCIGCGICASICPEGIEMVNGKAKIKNENIDCLKDAARDCPRNSIIIDGNEKGEDNSVNIRTGFGRGRGMGGRQGKEEFGVEEVVENGKINKSLYDGCDNLYFRTTRLIKKLVEK